MPDFLDVVWLHMAAGQFGQGGLGQAGGGADPEGAGDELKQRIADRGVRGVQPARQQTRQLRLGRGQQGLHHLGHRRRAGVGAGGGPDQGDGFRQVADVVVRHGEQDGIGAFFGEGADQEGLGGVERQLSRQRRQAETAVGVGLGGEVAAQEGDLGQAAGGEDQAFEQLGEGDHAAA